MHVCTHSVMQKFAGIKLRRGGDVLTIWSLFFNVFRVKSEYDAKSIKKHYGHT